MKLLLLSVILFFQYSYSNFKDIDKQITLDKENCKIDGLSYPKIICQTAIGFYYTAKKIQDELDKKCKDGTLVKKETKEQTPRNATPIFMLLYGKPGEGKSTLGDNLRKIFEAEKIFVASPNMFQKHYGETEENIKKQFDEAKKYIAEGKKVLMIIDEIDTIGYSQDKAHSEASPKPSASLQVLIDDLLKTENSGLLMIIATTNRKDAISGPLASRFNLKAEIKKPKNEEIADKIKTELDESGITIDYKKLIEGVKNSSSLRQAHLCANTLKVIKNGLKSEDNEYLGNFFCDCVQLDKDNSWGGFVRSQWGNVKEHCRENGSVYSVAASITGAACNLWNLTKGDKK